MANKLYPKGREKYLRGELAWQTDPVKGVLIDTGAYTQSDTHEFLSDIPVGARVATCAALTGKTTTLGVADADDLTFPSVTGPVSEAIALFKDTGSAATSPLIAYIDTAANLPATPNGGDIAVVWDPGANRIFKL